MNRKNNVRMGKNCAQYKCKLRTITNNFKWFINDLVFFGRPENRQSQFGYKKGNKRKTNIMMRR